MIETSHNEPMRSLSIGVVGAGDIARKVHLPVLLNLPAVSVDWIVDSSRERSRSVAAANRLRAVGASSPAHLPPCDVALLAIPVGARAAYYDAFAARGTAVFAEKPFAVTAAEHRALTARFPPHLLACGFMRRFYSSTRLLRHLIATRPFGRLRRMSISEGNRSMGSRVDRSYLDDPRQSASGGILSELACHSLDLAIFITGSRSYEIERSEFTFDASVDRKVAGTVILRGSEAAHDDGIVVDFCVSWLDRQSNTITLEFDNCRVWTEIAPGGTVRMGDPAEPAHAIALVPARRAAATANQAFFLQWLAFLDGVRSRTESDVSAQSALLGTALIEGLYARGRRHA